MTDTDFYENNVKKLGIDFYRFTERVSIMIIDGNLTQSDAQNTALDGLKKEQLSKFTTNIIRSDGY